MIQKIYSKIKNAIIKQGDADIQLVSDKKWTYLLPEDLKHINNIIQSIKTNKVKGEFIETGCALGGSAIYIAKKKETDRPFRVFDVFDMIPPPSDKDGQDAQNRFKTIKSGASKGIDGAGYYGYEDNLLDKVKGHFREASIDPEANQIEFVVGLYDDTLKVNHDVAMAHIDCDWYDSVMVCLERITPHLQTGGYLIIDDYFDWSGCKSAVDDFLSQTDIQFENFGTRKLYMKKTGMKNPV